MASETYQKILSIREMEKSEAQKAYKQSLERFEEVATKLFHLLQKKESVEERYKQFLEGKGTVTAFSSHFSYLEKIKAQIIQLESTVNAARSEMEGKQSLLTEAHVEAKKFEKLIERNKQKQLEQAMYLEGKTMDETSVIQYVSKDR